MLKSIANTTFNRQGQKKLPFKGVSVTEGSTEYGYIGLKLTNRDKTAFRKQFPDIISPQNEVEFLIFSDNNTPSLYVQNVRGKHEYILDQDHNQIDSSGLSLVKNLVEKVKDTDSGHEIISRVKNKFLKEFEKVETRFKENIEKNSINKGE